MSMAYINTFHPTILVPSGHQINTRAAVPAAAYHVSGNLGPCHCHVNTRNYKSAFPSRSTARASRHDVNRALCSPNYRELQARQTNAITIAFDRRFTSVSPVIGLDDFEILYTLLADYLRLYRIDKET